MDQRELLALLQGGQSLTDLPHAALYRARTGASPEMQGILAPPEHQAFAREWTQENPWLAVPALSAAIPAYSLAKMSGLLGTRSPASMDEIFAGYRGMLQGLRR